MQVRIIGGLGNQLFTYFAGVLYSEIHGKKLVVDLGQLEMIGTSHGASIAGFKLPHEVSYIKAGKYLEFWKRLRSVILRKRIISGKNFAKLSGFYASNEIGFDSEFCVLFNLSKVEGYFQTYRYFDALQDEKFKKLELPNPSAWFLENSQLLDSESYIVLHVRRGDFRKYKESVGLLSSSYYLRAVKEIDKLRSDNLPIWVFSDEIELAKGLLEGVSDRIVKFVDQPIESSANESLLLMSRAAAIVIANSTFSWWAATLGSKKIVIAPREWFKGAKNPTDLYPPNWHQIQSTWE